LTLTYESDESNRKRPPPRAAAPVFLLSGNEELKTVALILKPAWKVETHPIVVFALIFVDRRTCLRVANVADTVTVKVRLVWVRH
jgi:hypothetical protein